jgi:hypothetical protein
MSAPSTKSVEFTLTLNAEEHEHLLNLLEQAYRTTIVEVHRTDSSDFRKYVQRKETVIRGLLDKLRPS